jgi:polar amino acid transport system substrate-binding protein
MAIASQLAPTGRLRVGVWTVPYFAVAADRGWRGIIPDLSHELARRAGVDAELTPFGNPAAMVAAFRAGALDVTFLGVTADRAEAIDFGPVMLALQTTYLVPASSSIADIAAVDRPGVRIAVPAKSAQEAHLKKTIAHATLLPVPAEQPMAALDLIVRGEADAFSHVAPMLASVQGELPGSRILPGSYFDVPVAIGVVKGRAPTVADFARTFAEDAKASGFVQRAIARMGRMAEGVVVGM